MQVVAGRHFEVEKIRRTSESDPMPSSKSVFAKCLVNTYAVILGRSLWFVEVSRNKVYLKNEKTNKRIVVARATKNKNGLLVVTNLSKKVDSIKGIFLSPLYPWGESFDLMFMYLGSCYSHNLHHIPKKVSQLVTKYEVIISKKLQNDGHPVYWGASNSVLLMSVPWPHLHISKTSTPITIDQINNYRSIVNWDGGLSRSLGDHSTKLIKKWASKYNVPFTISPDNVGLRIHLPEFVLDDLLNSDKNHNGKFVKKVHSTIDRVIVNTHNQVYCSNFKEVSDYICDIKSATKSHSTEWLEGLFKLKDIDKKKISKRHRLLVKLHQSEHQVRRPGGWASLIRFEPDRGATLYVMFTFIHEPVGPFEGIGIKLAEHTDGKVRELDEAEIKRLFY